MYISTHPCDCEVGGRAFVSYRMTKALRAPSGVSFDQVVEPLFAFSAQLSLDIFLQIK